MAKLVVMVRDIVSEDFYMNCRCLKRGDVVDILPDDMSLGVEGDIHPQWRSIIAPQTPSDLSIFLAPEPSVGPTRSRTLQARSFNLDIDNPALPQSFKDFLMADHNGVAYVADFDVMQYRVRKNPIMDPAIVETETF